VPSDAVLVLDELANLLEGLRIPFVVGGSLASGSWGEPRSTHDVDVLIRLDGDRVELLVSELRPSFYVDLESVRDAVREARAFNVIHLGRYQKIDLFVAGPDALDVAQLESPIHKQIAPDLVRRFPVTAPELIVLRKLDGYCKGGMASERQWRDVLAVLRVQSGRLDAQLMDRLAGRSGLTKLLVSARRAAYGA
jgi:hypothetical protein